MALFLVDFCVKNSSVATEISHNLGHFRVAKGGGVAFYGELLLRRYRLVTESGHVGSWVVTKKAPKHRQKAPNAVPDGTERV